MLNADSGSQQIRPARTACIVTAGFGPPLISSVACPMSRTGLPSRCGMFSSITGPRGRVEAAADRGGAEVDHVAVDLRERVVAVPLVIPPVRQRAVELLLEVLADLVVAAEHQLGAVVVGAELAQCGRAVLGDHVGGDELAAAVARVELLDRAERPGLAVPDEPVLPGARRRG